MPGCGLQQHGFQDPALIMGCGVTVAAVREAAARQRAASLNDRRQSGNLKIPVGHRPPLQLAVLIAIVLTGVQVAWAQRTTPPPTSKAAAAGDRKSFIFNWM